MRATKSPLRETLTTSHIAAAAIAILLFWTVDQTRLGLWVVIPKLSEFLLTAAAIHAVRVTDMPDRYTLLPALGELLGACICFTSGWLLSRWVYGASPFHTLGSYAARITRRADFEKTKESRS